MIILCSHIKARVFARRVTACRYLLDRDYVGMLARSTLYKIRGRWKPKPIKEHQTEMTGVVIPFCRPQCQSPSTLRLVSNSSDGYHRTSGEFDATQTEVRIA